MDIQKEVKSFERLAFSHWLRTGHRLSLAGSPRERKFNPYHDPQDGRFTFAPGHGSLSPRTTDRAGFASTGGTQRAMAARGLGQLPREITPTAAPTQIRRNPRVRIGGNGGPELNDPMTLEHVFPSGRNTPVGTVLVAADSILDITGPANRLTAELASAHAKQLIREIQAVDTNFRFQSLGVPQTVAGQVNLIRELRVRRAVALQNKNGELRPLQVETLRQLQVQTDLAFNRGEKLFAAGRLRPRLSREEAIGNYIDREVRYNLKEFYSTYGVEVSKAGPVRIIGREYISNRDDATYRVPDARVGTVAFDVSLTRKTSSTAQIRGFFDGDFQPRSVVIVRPSQLGLGHSYMIAKPVRAK